MLCLTRTENYTEETMARKKSDEIRDTDGRKNNKRLPSKVSLHGPVTSKPARINDAKKKQIPQYAERAAKEVFGGIEQMLVELAQQGKDGNFNAFKEFLRYTIGNPDEYHKEEGPKKKQAPIINFINTNPEEPVIDIEHEEDGTDTATP